MMTSSQKVFDVLEYLCQRGPSRAIEISRALSLQKSSVHRFLNSLVEFGYVYKNDLSGQFGATLKIVQLGLMVGSRIDMVGAALPHMRQLVAEFNQTVGLGTLMDGNLLVLHREYPRNAMTHIDMSRQLPAYCTGMGKALLSALPEGELDDYIASVPRTAFTAHTLVDGGVLKENIMEAKRNGYAEDRGEISDALHCVSVPIAIPQGRIWSLSLSGHVSAISEIGVPVLVERLRGIARNLTAGAPLPT